MAYGFFTIEQWKPPKRGAESAWVPILHLDADHSLSDALRAIEDRDQTGFYGVVQTQRHVWAEKVDGKLHLRKRHAGSAEELARTAEAYERDGGKWPKQTK
jgi:hypothetical protein